MDKETVYVNGGEIYKDEAVKTVVNNYTYSKTADEVFSFTKNVSEAYPEGKQYIFTEEFKSYFPNDNRRVGIELTNYDLCPDVDLWIALGAPNESESQNYDLFFAVDNTAQLKSVAAYYNLPYPITSEVENIITNSPENIHMWKIGNRSIVPAGVQYRNGQPSILKLYTYPTEVAGWSTWMKGCSYHNKGELYESGSVLQQLTGGAEKEGYFTRGSGNYKRAESIESTVLDFTKTKYYFTKVADGGDPVIMWEAEETSLDSNAKRIKKYESSKMMRQVIGNLTSGHNFEEYNLPDDVSFVLGRSYYEDSDDTEVFFVATDSAQVKRIADHYGLQVPYNDRLKDKLDNDPASLRVRHYDMLGLGEGNFVPVVACGLVFVDGTVTQLKLYEFDRGEGSVG